MLNKNEKEILRILINKCDHKKTILISYKEIALACRNLTKYSKIELDQIIDDLILAEYITMVKTDRKGEEIFCITLTQKAESFLREQSDKKKKNAMLIGRTIALAVLSFVVGLILKQIFY